MRKKMMAAAMFSLTALAVHAQEEDTLRLQEVVVTGTKFEIPIEKSGKTIYKIKRQDIEKSAGKTVADLLNEVPGLEASGTYGTPGSNVNYYLRGGRNKNTLILIDGVPLNDPSAITAFYDLRFLSLDQVESIEVLNGGLSTLYGTGASAGVINIRLKDASEQPFAGSVDVNGGSYGAFQQGVNVNGTSAGFSYLLSATNARADGFSAAKENAATDAFDNDGFKRKNAMAKLGYSGGNFEVIATGVYNKFDAEYDDGAFFDADNKLKSDELRFGIKPTYKYAKGKVVLNAVYNQNHNDYKSSYPSEYKGRNVQADLMNEYQVNSTLKTLVGIDLQRPSYKQMGGSGFSDNEFEIIDPYASLLYESNSGVNIHVGARLNNHSEYGSHLIYSINPSYLTGLTQTVQLKIKASVSTAFVAPSLYQLYSVYGNADLKPEESTNYEGGGSVYVDKKLTFNATYFIRDEEEVIDFVSIFDDQGNYVGGQYQNIQDKRKVKGIELQMNWQVLNVLGIEADFSKLFNDDSSVFYRIPDTKWGAGITCQPLENANITLKYKRTGRRTDIDYSTFSEVTLDSYNIVDVYADYLLLQKVKIYGAVNNIFDEQFVNTVGFNTRGRNYNIGVSYKF